VHRIGGPRPGEVLAAMRGPLVACVPMFAGVRALSALTGAAPSVPLLVASIGVGAAVYAASAFVFARPVVMKLVKVAQAMLARRRGEA